jgi:hypothetical protein
MATNAFGEESGVAGTHDQPTAWTGWVGFAGVMMMLAGGLGAIQGFIAAVNDDWVVWGNRDDLYVDLSTWGWAHVIVGLIVFFAGAGVLTGNVLARMIGVAVAALSLIANFLILPAYPVWGLTVITMDVLIIWALTAHGGEMREL